MIVVRNVFQLKIGKAKEAIGLFKEMVDVSDRASGLHTGSRILTDATGPFYNLVLELQYESLAALEKSFQTVMATPEWQATYARILPLLEGGHREIFNVVQ